MKKLLIGVFAIIIAIVFSQCNCSPSATTGRTLNDIDEVTAGKMMQHFEDLKGSDNAPVTETFWISKEMIHDIVTLLHSEIQQQKARGRKDTTDGVRIYFASDLSVSTYPLNNKILLVSTKENGKALPGAQGCRSGKRHLDYYEHSASADLFKLSNHEIPCVSAGCPGCLLYNSSNPPGTVCNLPHDIPVSEAEEMVHYFMQNHTINTLGEWFDLCFFETMDRAKTPNGIRIYFARHKTCSVDPSKSFRDAFVITTTKRDPKTGITVDYFDCDEDLGKSYQAAYQAKYQILGGVPADNGELCPTNCN
ncbi:MAG: hypothetical protein ACXVB0_23315 [Mucilaginibacter sp.]